MAERPATGAGAEPEVGRANAAATYIGDHVAARDASSVLVVRQGGTDLEVLLVERHVEADFAGGALVFPGGKVSGHDRHLEPELWSGADLSVWRENLGAPSAAVTLGLLVAAVRETFEESGILLATRDGRQLDPDEVTSPAFDEVRSALCERGRDHDWRPFLRDQRLTLDLGALAMFAWWVTPTGQHKRFDTRFFLTRVPDGQEARQDDIETTSLRWIPPREAVAVQERGDAKVIFPTRRILSQLAAHPTAEDAWRAAREGAVDRRRTQPTLVERAGELWVRHPFDGSTERL